MATCDWTMHTHTGTLKKIFLSAYHCSLSFNTFNTRYYYTNNLRLCNQINAEDKGNRFNLFMLHIYLYVI